MPPVPAQEPCSASVSPSQSLSSPSLQTSVSPGLAWAEVSSQSVPPHTWSTTPSPSASLGAPGRHVPPAPQVSFRVQPSPSSQGAPTLGVAWQVPPTQVLSVQGLPSSVQEMGVPAQTPLWQLSSWVQGSPSSHAPTLGVHAWGCVRAWQVWQAFVGFACPSAQHAPST